MDELELLKKDWQKSDGTKYPKLSYDDIYKMLLKKSSSMVRWIFIISMCELALAIILNILFLDDDFFEQMDVLNMSDFFIVNEVISFGILGYFIYRFYKNYKLISVTDDSKTLMENILKTRKAVKTYIKIALTYSAIILLVTVFMSVLYDPNLGRAIDKLVVEGSPRNVIYLFIGAISLVVTAVIIVLFWLLYQLFYGLLLKRLNGNYKELKKMELQ